MKLCEGQSPTTHSCSLLCADTQLWPSLCLTPVLSALQLSSAMPPPQCQPVTGWPKSWGWVMGQSVEDPAHLAGWWEVGPQRALADLEPPALLPSMSP